jgi:hypothetical protein
MDTGIHLLRKICMEAEEMCKQCVTSQLICDVKGLKVY